jgi:hypothetical protein
MSKRLISERVVGFSYLAAGVDFSSREIVLSNMESNVLLDVEI